MERVASAQVPSEPVPECRSDSCPLHCLLFFQKCHWDPLGRACQRVLGTAGVSMAARLSSPQGGCADGARSLPQVYPPPTT